MSSDVDLAIRALEDVFPEKSQQLLETIIERNKADPRLEIWRQEQLVRFMFAISLNVDELLLGYAQKRIWKIAWAARNLLELLVWVLYCDKSPENAKRFRDDVARDLLGFSAAIQKLHSASGGAPNQELKKAMDGVVETAELRFGVSNIAEDFKRVADAAKELGMDAHFLGLNRLLSKFAHPTSLSLNSSIPAVVEIDAGFREMFLCDGTDAAITAMNNIRHRAMSTFGA